MGAYRVFLLNKESASLWTGNVTVYVKGSASTRLKMEEFITRMTPMCSMPERGFGRGEEYLTIIVPRACVGYEMRHG